MEKITFNNGKAEIEANEDGFVDVVITADEPMLLRLTAEEAYELADVLQGEATVLDKMGLS